MLGLTSALYCIFYKRNFWALSLHFGPFKNVANKIQYSLILYIKMEIAVTFSMELIIYVFQYLKDVEFHFHR